MKKYYYIFIIPILFIIFVSNSKKLKKFTSNFYNSYFGRTSKYYLRLYNNKKVSFDDIDYNSNNSLIFITYGQSNSANSGENNNLYSSKYNVYMTYKGDIYNYKDPSIGAQGFGSSTWGLLGEKLIKRSNGRIKNVFFTNTGVGGQNIESLISDEKEYLNYFLKEVRTTIDKFGKIDAVLFHHGESNNNNTDLYYDSFSTLIDSINNITNIPIYLSQASYCENIFSEKLIAIQNKLIIDKELVLRGPNTDSLRDGYRYDDCHFNSRGLSKLSELWHQSITLNSEQ